MERPIQPENKLYLATTMDFVGDNPRLQGRKVIESYAPVLYHKPIDLEHIAEDPHLLFKEELRYIHNYGGQSDLKLPYAFHIFEDEKQPLLLAIDDVVLDGNFVGKTAQSLYNSRIVEVGTNYAPGSKIEFLNDVILLQGHGGRVRGPSFSGITMKGGGRVTTPMLMRFGSGHQ